MKRIASLMTPQPWTVRLDDSIAVARRMIAERKIHHLPVLERDTVVGMVTERDLALAADRLGTVGEVMAPVHRVDADTPLDDVLDAMTTRRWDAVVITTDDQVAGIFTTSDAVRVLRDTLRRRRARPSPPSSRHRA
jgi:CBS domain-containing protein